MKKTAMLFLISIVSLLNARQIVKKSGEVFVNQKPMKVNQKIKLGDFIQTKSNSKIVFNIGKSAFMAKENTQFKITDDGTTKTLNVISGGVLAVFQHGDEKHEVKTPNMTAGIRGTGIFAKVEQNKSYFCTCYGKTELVNEHNRHAKKLIASHHNMVWVTQTKIKPVKKMLGHNDKELRELEAIVGRIPDFDK